MSNQIKATPLARKIAALKGINLANIKGTGPYGRILRADLTNASSVTPQSSNPSVSNVTASVSSVAQPMPERMKMTGLRKAIAKNMKNSLNKTALCALMDEAVVNDLVKMRSNINSHYEKQGIKISYLPVIMKAIALGLKKFPIMNSSVDETAEEIIFHNYVNIAIGVDTPKGLYVPVVKDVDKKNILDIAEEIKVLAAKAKDGKLTGADQSNSTFTITNYGSIGALFGVPVINYPNSSIIGLGSIIKKPIIDKTGNIVAANVLPLSVSFDHRIIDGADAARWMNYVKSILENPHLFMTSMV